MEVENSDGVCRKRYIRAMGVKDLLLFLFGRNLNRERCLMLQIKIMERCRDNVVEMESRLESSIFF